MKWLVVVICILPVIFGASVENSLLKELRELLDKELHKRGAIQCESKSGTTITVPPNQQCDFEPDCKKMEDERGCDKPNIKNVCNDPKIDVFKCGDGQCIPRVFLCDSAQNGKPAQDCYNNADQANCPPGSVKKREVTLAELKQMWGLQEKVSRILEEKRSLD